MTRAKDPENPRTWRKISRVRKLCPCGCGVWFWSINGRRSYARRQCAMLVTRERNRPRPPKRNEVRPW